MASTYSTNLGIELIATGEQSGTWGATTNTNLGTLIEQAISGYVTQAITDGSGANTTITMPDGTTGVARNMFLELTGALTYSTTSLIVPADKKLYFIYNNTTGGYAVTVKVTGLTGVSVPNGRKVILVCNGTDIVEAHNAISGNATVGGTLVVTGATTAASFSGAGTGLTGTAASLTAGNATTSAALTNGGTLNTPGSGTLTSCTGLPIDAGTTGTLPVLRGGTGVTTSTGSGANVLSTSPTLVTPALGTPSSGALNNCTFPTLNQNTTGSSGSCTGNAATATNPQSGGTFITSSNIGSQTVSTAGTCTGNAATATNPQSGGTFITSSNISGQSVTFATTSTNATNATNATTATNLSGGSVSATTITSSGNITSGSSLRADSGYVASGSLAGTYTDFRYDGYIAGYGGWSGVTIDGDLDVIGSKNFKIPHPLEQLSESKFLVHAAVESPVVQNFYQGMVRLVNGKATVNIDEKFGMTSGTFAALNRNFSRQTTNESGAANVWSSLSGAVLEVFCVDQNSTDEVYWMVSGERKDKKIYEAGSTDSNGHLIVEPVRDFEKERKIKADYEANKQSLLTSNNS